MEIKNQKRLNKLGAFLCVVGGVLGFLVVILMLGNYTTYITPLYTWLANM